jgi:tetratricopeptide (TPR) repeat protein/tRNA A-37 threonylcarbamoyl transferase component Bud32
LGCEISKQQLWSWIDRQAAELDEHLATCPECRALAADLRAQIGVLAVPLTMSALPLPDKIGPYRIRRLIGEGGQALVYEAEQASPTRAVALKVLRGGPFADERQIHRFQREIQTLARLHHPYIATIHEAGRTAEGQYYIAMELVEGRPLDRYVAEVDLSLADRIRLCRLVCAAVQYAHEHGVVHRDLKPPNILVQEDGTPRILDFGLARLTLGDATQAGMKTRTGTIEGTPRYMSPEQLRGEAQTLDHRCDVYALGVLFFELLTGETPFVLNPLTSGGTLPLDRGEPKRAGRIDPRLRGDLEAILDHALEPEPAKRYASVRAFDEDLGRHLEGQSISVRRLSLPRRWARMFRKRRAIVGAGIVIGAMACVFAWLLTRPQYDIKDAERQLRIAQAGLLAAPVGADQSATVALCERFPGLMESTLLSAQASFVAGGPGAAVTTLKQGLERNASWWPCHFLLAEIYERQHDAQEASAERALAERSFSPDRAEDWLLRSLATLDLSESARCISQALRIDPNHFDSREQRLHMLDAAGDTLNALACMDTLLRLRPGSRDLLRFKGLTLMKLGRMDESMEVFGRLLLLPSPMADDYTKHAHLERLAGDYPVAFNDLTQALSMARGVGVGWVLFHRGTVQWILGRPDSALADYARSCKWVVQPTYADIRAAIILRELGRREEALGSLDKAARLAKGGDKWLPYCAQCIAGRISPDSLVRVVPLSDRMGRCEAYYYAGEAYLASGQDDSARVMFRRCTDLGVRMDPRTRIDPVTESELAAWRLKEKPAATQGN